MSSENLLYCAYGIEIPEEMENERAIFENLCEERDEIADAQDFSDYNPVSIDEDFPILFEKEDRWNEETGRYFIVKEFKRTRVSLYESVFDFPDFQVAKELEQEWLKDTEWTTKLHEFLDKHGLSALKSIEPKLVTFTMYL